MPNYCRTLVTVTPKIMKEIKEKYFEKGQFSLNKVIPMPGSLELTSGGITNSAIYYAFLKKDANEQKEIIELLKGVEDILHENMWEDINQYYSNDSLETLEKDSENYIPDEKANKLGIKTLEELGNTYIDNIRKYGFPTWYEWHTENWGTKWNVRNFVCGNSSMSFDTAWATPYPVLAELSKRFPEEEIEIEVTDYDNDEYQEFVLINGEAYEYETEENEEVEHEQDKDVVDYNED